jgi:Bestrophin, RFP-TM, chloride channel
MIVYEHGFLGLGTLTRIHGSAAYQVILPAIISTCFLIGLHQYRLYYSDELHSSNTTVIQNPYAIGALISFFSFLLTFRLNYSYMRYWEGATSVHNMLSEWLDCGSMLAAFHYQSKYYHDIEPPTFAELCKEQQFANTNGIISLNDYYFIGRDRDHRGPQSYEEAIQQIQNQKQKNMQQVIAELDLNNNKEPTVAMEESNKADSIIPETRHATAATDSEEILPDATSAAAAAVTPPLPTVTTASTANTTTATVSNVRTRQSSFGMFRRSDTYDSSQTSNSKHSDKAKAAEVVGGGGGSHIQPIDIIV